MADDLIFQPSLMDLDLGRVHLCLVWSKYVEQARHTRELANSGDVFSNDHISDLLGKLSNTLLLPGVPA